MSYYKVFGLTEEPFSTSPDPSFFYESAEHREALLRLEISIKQKRGLHLLLGDVGAGKTTLARKLFAQFEDKNRYDVAMVLDPSAASENDFWNLVSDAFGVKPEEPSLYSYRKALEAYLFHRGVDQGRTVVLLIDEAQKLSAGSIEILRTLLNYETNKFKLLQLVLFGQMELLPEISKMRNVWERIALKFVINPLNLDETRALIEHRLRQAGWDAQQALFSEDAVGRIHARTGGCPRRIMMLCHDALETLIVKNRERVTVDLIDALAAEEDRIVHARPV